MSHFYQVAVNFPKKDSVFTYESEEIRSRGDLVEVPFGKRKAQGTIVRASSRDEIAKSSKYKIKQINSLVENSFPLGEDELSLYEWMSSYYHYSLGKLIYDCLPKVLKRPRKIDFIQGDGKALPFELSEDQGSVYHSILDFLSQGFSQHYIHGVTGSGKSAVYLHLMKKTLEMGQSVQFLLPEINLTPQFTRMFGEYLDCEVYTYHSGVTASEKYTIWKALQDTKRPVLVMGVRSSIFLPINDLGLVIVDEEHDQSFKQSDRCPYNGRDVAIKKAQIHSVPIVLGSATPTVENYYNFGPKNPNKNYYSLKKRVGDGAFPTMLLMDTKDRFKEKDPAWPLLDETVEEIEKALDKKEQVLVFINKLGYAQFLQCRNCGHQFYNDNCGCQNNLRYFKQKNCLSCSHCDFSMPAPDQCPECAGISLMNKGFGTEKVEQVLSDLFPDRHIERFDRDEIKNVADLNKKLTRFNNHEIDIFVGTQMLAKGHNFKKVNLVIVLGIDSSLNYADFRSSEKTYQLLEQISGRAGRYAEGAKVIVQTLNPDHKIFELIKAHSFDGFYEEELLLRELCECPPFSRIAMINFSSRFREKLIPEITEVGNQLQKLVTNHYPQVRILGPTPLSIEKKANQFSWAIMLKSSNIKQLHMVINSFESSYQESSNISFKIDIDPMQIL